MLSEAARVVYSCLARGRSGRRLMLDTLANPETPLVKAAASECWNWRRSLTIRHGRPTKGPPRARARGGLDSVAANHCSWGAVAVSRRSGRGGEVRADGGSGFGRHQQPEQWIEQDLAAGHDHQQ